MPPRRRTITSPLGRRPRVAGQTRRAEDAESADVAVTTVAGPPSRPGHADAPVRPGQVDAPVPPVHGDGSARSAHGAGGMAGPAAGAGPRASAPVVAEPEAADPEAADPEAADRVSTGSVAADPATSAPVDEADVAGGAGSAAAGGGAGTASGRFARLRTVPVLAAALVLLLAAATFFGAGIVTLRGSAAATNTALTDVATTSEVTAQLGDALELVYSYDFARLDENERAAREVISPAFTAEFDPLYAQVRELAPQVQAVVSAVVTASAVRSIEGDRAVLVAYMDQQATTIADGQQAASQGRLTVTGVRIDGRWKLDAVESR